jgi:hypothetical protein
MMAPTAKPASAGGAHTLSIARGMLSDPPLAATIKADPPTPPIAAPISPRLPDEGLETLGREHARSLGFRLLGRRPSRHARHHGRNEHPGH